MIANDGERVTVTSSSIAWTKKGRRWWLLAQVTSPSLMYYSRLFKVLSRQRITWDYYDRHVRHEAFVGPRRYDDEQPRFFRLTSVRAMNLKALRSLEVSWYIRNARFRIVISLFLPAVWADSMLNMRNSHTWIAAPVVLSIN